MRTFFLKISDVFARLFRRPRPANPDDPYAYVRVPKGPRLPQRSAAVALIEPDEQHLT